MTDYAKYKELYLLCFTEDTEEDAELLFKNVLSKAKLISENYKNGSPIAMLFLMDANIIQNGKALDYYYLYAACTHPSYRGKGIMGNLLERAKETAIKDKKLGIFLKPANPPLFNFYAKSGFLPYFNICKIDMDANTFINQYSPELLKTESATIEEWYYLRKEFLSEINSSYVDFSKEILITASDGCSAIKSKDFGFVYETRDKLLLVKEAICTKDSVNKLLSAISYILKNSNCDSLEIRLPPLLKDQLANFDHILQPFSVIWFTPNANQPPNTNGHHGFAFD